MSTSEAKTSENPNIGVLGGAQYQEHDDRIKGFCGTVIEDPKYYMQYLKENVVPLINAHDPSRIIDRVIVRTGMDLTPALDFLGMGVEANVLLGGRWEGFEWIMSGRTSAGRVLSENTQTQLRNLAKTAQKEVYSPLRELPEGFNVEVLESPSRGEIEKLVEIYRQSFDDYITPLSDSNYLRKYLTDNAITPVVTRINSKSIIAVATGVGAEIIMDNGVPFKFMELGDSGSDPRFRNLGLNRHIKQLLIRLAKQQGYDSIHAEARASWGSPNFANARNGMEYCGMLPSNCTITGPADIPETADVDLADWARKFGSLNIWALTPVYSAWERY